MLLGFERPFWEEREGGRDFWGWTAPNGRRRGEAFQFWNLQRSTGRPLLLVLHAGRAALRKARAPLREAPGGQEAPPPLRAAPRRRRQEDTREEAKQAAIRATMDALRAIFGEEAVPAPTLKLATQWEHEHFSRGVYSHVAVGATARDYDVLAEPLWGDSLLFAGEATSREHPATVAGAPVHAWRAAHRLQRSFRRPSARE